MVSSCHYPLFFEVTTTHALIHLYTMEYFNSTIRDDALDPDSSIPYADDDFTYANGINGNLHTSLDNTGTNRNDLSQTKVNDNDPEDVRATGHDREDIDIEALLNRPRYYGRLRRSKPLESAPEFVKRLEPFFEVPAGVPVVFECKVSAFPNATVKWYMDDEEVTDEHARYHVQHDDSHGVHRLLVESAAKVDEGAFKCKAENREGVASTTGYLSVTGDDKEKPLLSQHRRLHREQAISAPPPLCTIVEQKSVEEREAKAQAEQGPSPIQGYINNIRKGTSWTLINMVHLYHSLTSSKDDEEDDDDRSSSGSQTDVIDSSEPSTPTAECDVIPLAGARSSAIASWAELAQSLANQSETETADGDTVHSCSAENVEDRIGTGITDVTRDTETINVLGTESQTEQINSQSGDPVINKNHSCQLPAANFDTTQQSKYVKKRVIKVTKERRKKFKKQPSLVELTVQRFVVKLTSMFGEQLDKPWLYYFAFTILGACFAAAIELNPVYMIITVALLSFVSFYFICKFDRANSAR